AGPGRSGGGQRPAQRLAAGGGAEHVHRADRRLQRLDRPGLLGGLLRGKEGLPAPGSRTRPVAGNLALLREGRVEGGPVRLGAAERAPPTPRGPGNQLQPLRTFLDPRFGAAGAAPGGLAAGAEDDVLRALERYRRGRVRVVQSLTARTASTASTVTAEKPVRPSAAFP